MPYSLRTVLQSAALKRFFFAMKRARIPMFSFARKMCNQKKLSSRLSYCAGGVRTTVP